MVWAHAIPLLSQASIGKVQGLAFNPSLPHGGKHIPGTMDIFIAKNRRYKDKPKKHRPIVLHGSRSKPRAPSFSHCTKPPLTCRAT